MDDNTFQIKNLEFHIKQSSINYDKCVSKAVKHFLDSNSDFSTLIKPCEPLKRNLDELMKKYEEINSIRLDS